MTTADDAILDAVRTAVAEAMYVEKDEVQPGTAILIDLEADSVDLLDILFRIEQKTGIGLEVEDLVNIQGNLSDEEFIDTQGYVTPRGLAHLREHVPAIDLDALGEQVTVHELVSQITVEYLAQRITEAGRGESVAAS